MEIAYSSYLKRAIIAREMDTQELGDKEYISGCWRKLTKIKTNLNFKDLTEILLISSLMDHHWSRW